MAIKRKRSDIKTIIKKRIENRHNRFVFIEKKGTKKSSIENNIIMNDRDLLRIYGASHNLIKEVVKKPIVEKNEELTRQEKRIGVSQKIKELSLKYNKYNDTMIGILIVNLNNLNLTKNCIITLKKQINQNFKIYLFDQNSTEKGTSEYLNECENNEILVFRNSENVPLNYIWNNFKNVCDLNYLCFLNNDVELTNTFIDDTIKILDNEPTVGAVNHVTNNTKYSKANSKLEYKIFDRSLYQGWDFTIRRSIMPEIPKELKIFGGDDYIFAKINTLGYKIAIAFSSPIIHYKEKTRINIPNIAQIQQEDGKFFREIILKERLIQVDSTMNHGISNKFPPTNMKLTQEINCVFTAIIGDYDSLLPTSFVKLPNWDYICFTDNADIKSDFWRVIYINNKNVDYLANVKLARHFKTNFYKYLLGYDKLMWMDARITIIGNINDYAKKLEKKDIIFLRHPDARNIKEEFDRVMRGNIEKKDMVGKIKERYASFNYKYDNGLISSGVLLFKNNEKTIKFFKEWWYEIENYSHRDQLSANFVLWRNSGINYEIVGGLMGVYFKQLPRNTVPFRYKS